MTDGRVPCIVGVAQRTLHPGRSEESPEPLVLWEEMARAACVDAGADVLPSLDRLGVIYSLSWQYDDPPGRLAERLGLPDASRHYSGLSGTSPHKLLHEAAREILAGRCEAALVVGGEALATRRRLKREGRRPEWSFRPAEKPAMPFEQPFHPAEVAHEVFQAYLTFAVFDVARRAHMGVAPAAHRQHLGELLAPLSAVAAKNPRAWAPVERSPSELIEATPANRMVAYPYTKTMVSIPDVDMAAALVVTSHDKADALGVPADRRVYLRGWSEARDPAYVAERDALWRSRSMAEASAAALAGAGIGIDDVAHLDLYSCFGSSLDFARDALGLAEGDARALSVTGGLPFHGGPGNNYLTHSIATMVERLREESSAFGLVSGVGMHMQNHSYGVYSATPGPVAPPDEAAVQARVDAEPRRAIENTAAGPARIAGYSVVHGREGPGWALAVCDLPRGSRCYARSEDPALLEALEREEWVGRPVELRELRKGVNELVAS